MPAQENVAQLERSPDAVLASGLRESGGSRSTRRIDDEGRGWNVDLVCAEALPPAVKSLAVARLTGIGS
ncbi:MAG: hypothetical protein ABIR52_13980 [Casimicrobiaceae bacterium]